MTNQTKELLLPDELQWADGGHASDIVLTAMADGQLGIIPPAVLAHIGACHLCTTHLGNAALLSLHTGRELAFVARLEVNDAAAGARFPRLAVALGLAFAAVGLVPTLVDASSQLRSAKAFATQDMPVLVSGLQTLGRSLLAPGSASGLVLNYGAAALLVLMGLVLVRLLPKKEGSR